MPPEVTGPWRTESTMLPARTQNVALLGTTILAVWWQDAAWVDVTVRMENEWDYHSAEPSFRIIGGMAGCDRVVTTFSNFKVAINVGAVEVYSMQGGTSGSITETVKQINILQSAVITASRTLDGVTADESRTVGEGDLFALTNWSFGIPQYVKPIYVFDGALKPSPSTPARVSRGVWQISVTPDDARAFSLVRYSPSMIGVVARDSSSSYRYLPPITRAGASGSTQTRSFSPLSRRLYGSVCPVTGETRWLYESPVCWV